MVANLQRFPGTYGTSFLAWLGHICCKSFFNGAIGDLSIFQHFQERCYCLFSMFQRWPCSLCHWNMESQLFCLQAVSYLPNCTFLWQHHCQRFQASICPKSKITQEQILSSDIVLCFTWPRWSSALMKFFQKTYWTTQPSNFSKSMAIISIVVVINHWSKPVRSKLSIHNDYLWLSWKCPHHIRDMLMTGRNIMDLQKNCVMLRLCLFLDKLHMWDVLDDDLKSLSTGLFWLYFWTLCNKKSEAWTYKNAQLEASLWSKSLILLPFFHHDTNISKCVCCVGLLQTIAKYWISNNMGQCIFFYHCLLKIQYLKKSINLQSINNRGGDSKVQECHAPIKKHSIQWDDLCVQIEIKNIQWVAFICECTEGIISGQL